MNLFGRAGVARVLLSFLFILSVCPSEAANAASLTVKIRQLNPAGGVQQVTCAPKTKCALPIDIQTGQTKETLTVGISFVPGSAVMRFQTPEGYLCAGEKNPADKYAIYGDWHDTTGKSKSSVTTLFIPLHPSPIKGLLRSDMKQPVADLEITTEQLP